MAAVARDVQLAHPDAPSRFVAGLWEKQRGEEEALAAERAVDLALADRAGDGADINTIAFLWDLALFKKGLTWARPTDREGEWLTHRIQVQRHVVGVAEKVERIAKSPRRLPGFERGLAYDLKYVREHYARAQVAMHLEKMSGHPDWKSIPIWIPSQDVVAAAGRLLMKAGA